MKGTLSKPNKETDARDEAEFQAEIRNTNGAPLYDFAEIREAGSCKDFAINELGIELNDNRCAATWRGGSNPTSVEMFDDGWCDYADPECEDSTRRRSVVDLCALVKFGGDGVKELQQAQKFLGEFYGLRPINLKKSPGKIESRADLLESKGFKALPKYSYVDLQGKERYFVQKFVNPRTKEKQFLQGTEKGWGIRGITPILYNWPEVAKAKNVFIVEGEKDVETMRKQGLVATTSSGGAKNWSDELNEALRDKNIIILPDNDKVGKAHADMIAHKLYGIAAGIKVVVLSALPKGDVTDFLEKENGSIAELNLRVKAAPLFRPTKTPKVLAAIEANKKPLCNYVENVVETANGKERVEKIARPLGELVKDVHTRLLGAPYKVGEQLFDHDRDTKDITYIYDAAGLYSFMALKTGQNVLWPSIEGAPTKQEFFEALKSQATKYENISYVPDYPRRDTTYYSHPELPKPTEGHRYFWGFVDMFSPVDDDEGVNRALLAAFIMAPIYHKPLTDKPLWVIDSPSGQGVGKSALPQMVAALYGRNMEEGRVLDASIYDIDRNYAEIVRRLLSSAGRTARIFRVDNVTGTLKCPNLASLVTTSSISGRPSYGRGEETRKNDLTYCITANGCQLDTDLASRSHYIMLKKPVMDAHWKDNVIQYISEHKMQIMADIIDILSTHKAFDIAPVTRTPEFEVNVLQAACQTPEMYSKVVTFIMDKKEETNTDEDVARRVEEEFSELIKHVAVIRGLKPITEEDGVFIYSDVIEDWFADKDWLGKNVIQEIRALGRSGMIRKIDSSVMRYPPKDRQGIRKRSGILWNTMKGATPIVVRKKGQRYEEVPIPWSNRKVLTPLKLQAAK